MQNTPVRFGPVALAAAAANIINCAITSLAGPVGYTQAQPYLLITHIRIVNKTNAAVTVSLYIGTTGASAAGTEFLGTALSIPANQPYDWYGRLKLSATDFLTGLASAATSATFQAEGEIGIAG